MEYKGFPEDRQVTKDRVETQIEVEPEMGERDSGDER